MSRLEKNDSDRIGFVNACLFHQALEVLELNKWAEINYEISSPDYMLELIGFDAPLFHLSKVIGFSPVWDRNPGEENALYGIAYRRKKELFDCPVSRSEALEALNDNPHVLERFKKEFPLLVI